MDSDRRTFTLGIAIATLAVALGISYLAYQVQRNTPGTAAWTAANEKVLRHVAGWHATPRGAAQLMLERFGPPDQSTPIAVIWKERAPWKRITVHKDWQYSPLEQTVSYYVPRHRMEMVRALKNGIGVDIWNNELSAQSGREALNFLALNLADEIAREQRAPEDARAFYDKTVELSAAGKSSYYLEGLLFKPQRVEAVDWEYPAFELK